MLHRSPIWSAAKAIAAATALVAAWSAIQHARAEPPEGADPKLAPWFHSLKQPNTGMECCDFADCRPVEARPSVIGWEVFIDRKSFGADAPDGWRPVPPQNILHRKDNPVGEPVACWFIDRVMCFVTGPET